MKNKDVDVELRSSSISSVIVMITTTNLKETEEEEEEEINQIIEKLKTIEPEEATRIMKFKFLNDKKRSLLGRLLIRNAFSNVLKVEKYELLRFQRDSNNKPFYNNNNNTIEFNISHHGSYVVGGFLLNKEKYEKIGIDVMTYEEPKKGKLQFFEIMKNNFTPHEWKQIDCDLTNFYMFWSLKESYIKAIGLGLGFNLKRISFTLNFKTLFASVEIDEKQQNDWIFCLKQFNDKEAFNEPGCIGIGLKYCNVNNDNIHHPIEETIQFKNIDGNFLLKEIYKLL